MVMNPTPLSTLRSHQAPSRLAAIEQPWMRAVLQNTNFLAQIADKIDGAFHLLEPESFVANLTAFAEILIKHQVKGRVFYAKKANKATIWLKKIARLNGFVDVASVPEFSHALANGIQGSHLTVTGAAKSDKLLKLAAQHHALIAIDALDELARAVAIADPAQPLRILLRVLPPEFPDSRFGLNPTDMQIALQKCVAHRQLLTMEGFSFHLDGYAVHPRAALAFQLIDQCLVARKMGLAAHSVSIGGGFACAYVTEECWRHFHQHLNPDHFHGQKSFAKFYPYYQSPTGAAMLDAILQTHNHGRSLSQALNQADITLLMEPGRALLNGAGLSVFPVQGFKQNDQYGLVTVAGLSMSLSEQWKGSEFLPDPYLIELGCARKRIPTLAAIGGSSCMEYDMLSWRKISFPARPRYGDLIIYPNTAGYQMDKNESTFHQLALPAKIIVCQKEGKLEWRMDE